MIFQPSLRILTILVLTLLSTLLLSIEAKAIIGGKYVAPGAPLERQVALIGVIGEIYGIPAISNCTGTFINERVVLTAAHCFKTIKPTSVTISMGVDADRRPVFSTTALKIARFTSESAVVRERSDVALILTKDPIPKNFIVTKLAKRQPTLPGVAMAAGYGDESEVSSMIEYVPPALKVLRMVITQTPDFQEGMVAALAGDNTRTAHGDSGGPLFVMQDGEFVQAGVLNGGKYDPELTYDRSVYASTILNRAWIDQTSIMLHGTQPRSAWNLGALLFWK